MRLAVMMDEEGNKTYVIEPELSVEREFMEIFLHLCTSPGSFHLQVADEDHDIVACLPLLDSNDENEEDDPPSTGFSIDTTRLDDLRDQN